jgi:coiled-coil domain-containing protein 22
MSEVDEIILVTLRELDAIDDSNESGEKIRGVGELKPNEVLKGVLRCLATIDASLEYGETIPKNMSARVGLCSAVVETIKTLGYREGIGYHQLMYPNPVENRKLLSFLIGLLPAASGSGSLASSSGAAGASLSINDVAANAVSQSAVHSLFFSPSFTRSLVLDERCAQPSNGNASMESIVGVRVKSCWQFRAESLRSPSSAAHYDGAPLVTEQPSHRASVAPSVLEANAVSAALASEWEAEWSTRGLESGLAPGQYWQRKRRAVAQRMASSLQYELSTAAAGGAATARWHHADIEAASAHGYRSRFSHQVDFEEKKSGGADGKAAAAGLSKEEAERQKEETRVAELASLDDKAVGVRTSMDEAREQMQAMSVQYQQIKSTLFEEQQRTEALKRDLLVKRKTMQLLPEADANMAQLRTLADEQAAKIQALAAEWDVERVALVDRYRALRASVKDRTGDVRSLLDEIRVLRAQIEELRASAKQRYDRYKALLDTWQQLPKDISRETYTVRILDIVRQTKKQKVDIDKILIDTRNINKEINSVSESLFRSFSVTSELVFADATKDDTAKQAYKLLAHMHKLFEKLVQTVSRTGHLRRDILTLEDKHAALDKRLASLNIDQIVQDLEQLQKESK